MKNEIYYITEAYGKPFIQAFLLPVRLFMVPFVSMSNAIGPYWSWEEAQKVCVWWEGGKK